jgi:tetratricopeptide (TPR) repeat protein
VRSLTLRTMMLVSLYTAQATARSVPDASVIFTRDIAPIVFDRCAICHHPGGSAPFSLLTYAEVRQRATQIAVVTKSRFMPPWRAESAGEFVGQHPLTDHDIDLIQRWVREGATEGDQRYLPREPQWPDGWQLGAPDLILPFPAGYTLPAVGPDVFRVFVIHVPIDVTRYVRALEFRPGNPRVVHHADIRMDRTPASRILAAQEPEPGYGGLLALSAAYPDGHLVGWAPGQLALPLPRGLEWRLEPGTDLVVQLHMKPSGKPEPVQPAIGFYFGADPPQRTPGMLRLGRQAIDIPPGETSYTLTDSFVLPVDVEVQAIQPHAHYRGREINGLAKLPDGTTTSLVHIKDWDFNWQQLYQFAKPIRLPSGTLVEMRYTYDNSAGNPRNPQLPPRRVSWGQQSTDEMGDLWLQVLTRDDRDLAILNARFRPKMVAEDIAGYETALRTDPANIALHDDAAQMYLELGRASEAVAHFRSSATLKPESAAAHFNLGVALTAAGKLDEAIASYRTSLRLRPDYALAHTNLGYALMLHGNLLEAIEQYRAALRADPASAVAHNNLGNGLLQHGDIVEAMSYLREALRLDPAFAEAHYNIARASQGRGEFAEALEHYRQAARLKADWTPVLADLAWLLATAPDGNLRNGSEAIRLAERAVSLTGRRSATPLDVLAAAYAEAGLFDRAVTTAQAAIELASPSGPIATAILERQELYKQHRPYRLRIAD